MCDGETGFLAQPGDAAALAERIAGLLADPALRNRCGTAGRARVLELFTWERVVARVETCYEQAFSGALASP
jgi:glycosyltransferase involved in cell wall biosynthesis